MSKTRKRRQPKLAKTERRLAALSRSGFKHAPACAANRARSPFVNALLRSGFKHALAWPLAAMRLPPQMPPALSIKERHVSHRTALISDTQRAQDKLMASMSAKRSAAAACLLAGLHRKSRRQTPLTAAVACLLTALCACSVSWAQAANEQNEQFCEAPGHHLRLPDVLNQPR